MVTSNTSTEFLLNNIIIFHLLDSMYKSIVWESDKIMSASSASYEINATNLFIRGMRV